MRRSASITRISLLALALAVGVPAGSATLGFPALAPGAAASGPQALRGDLDRILADQRLDGAHAGVVVRDANTGDLLYQRAGGQRQSPASNAKLLTSAAALDVLGPDHRFRTEVRGEGERRGGTLAGDLVLRGGGDPTMLAADYDRLAAQVAHSGVTRVTGRVIADASHFDGPRLGTGWAHDDEPYYYAAPISALTVAPTTDFDAGSVLVRATPGASAGDPVSTTLQPQTGVVRIDNRARTGAPDSPSTLDITREHGTNRIVVSGSIPAGAGPEHEYLSVPRPADYAADVFTRALAAHGVHVNTPGFGHRPARSGSPVLAQRTSMPLAQLLTPFLKLSNNNHAETLVKEMGAVVHGEGSWQAGLKALRDALPALGVDPDALRLVDGSGLSPLDSVSPQQLTSLLRTARARPWFRTWYEAQPIAGQEDRMVGGTLRHRMDGTPAEGNVHGKTGSFTGANALSGYVTGANGEPLVFSVLLNDFTGQAPRDIEDAVAVRLAQYRGAADRPRPTPRRHATAPHRADGTRPRESTLECSWLKAC